MEKAIKVKNVSKTIKGIKILKNISFEIDSNTIVGLVGPNGAGKSTLLKIMTGLYKQDEGTIEYYGIDLNTNYEKAISLVGSIIENPSMYKNLTGMENLKLFKNMFKNVSEDKIINIARLVNIEKSLGKKFKTYSLGMKERLGVASTMLNDPKILILDEPTNGLDPVGIKELRILLKSMKNTTILISSHLLSEIENLCDEVIFIKEGKIIEKKKLNQINNKKYIQFEVDDYSKASYIIGGYVACEDLKVYATDEEVSKINKELIYNNINVYRIEEKKSNLEREFFDIVGNNDD